MSKRSLAVAVILSWGTVAAAADSTLSLVWSDPQKRLSRGYDTMTREVSEILQHAGLDVTWSPLTEKTFRTTEPKVLVILVPRSGAAWGLPEDTLGAVMGRGGPVSCVYVFYPPLKRSLGMSPMSAKRSMRPTSPAGSLRDAHVLARAVARVAAHEIVHALAPWEPHSAEGLMQARLSRRALVGKELTLSNVTLAAHDKE